MIRRSTLIGVVLAGLALIASATACQSILGIEDTTVDGDAGPEADAAVTTVRLVEGHIGTVGPSEGGTSTLKLVDHGFERGGMTCSATSGLCVSGGITP